MKVFLVFALFWKINSENTVAAQGCALWQACTLTNSMCTFTQCEKGWSSYNNECLMIIKQQDTWMNSLTKCERLGGTLASIKSTGKANFVQNLIGTTNKVWTGAIRTGSTGQTKFYWRDNTVVASQFWYPGEPNIKNAKLDLCAVTCHNSVKICDTGCPERYYALCQKQKISDCSKLDSRVSQLEKAVADLTEQLKQKTCQCGPSGQNECEVNKDLLTKIDEALDSCLVPLPMQYNYTFFK